MEQDRKRRDFFHGAMILTAGMAAVKVIGALFKIPLKWSIGEYGMGLFNAAYSFYGPVFSLATAGFPVAVSRLVSESRSLGRWNDVRQIKRIAFPLFLFFGIMGGALMTLLAPLYCTWVIGEPNAIAPVLALAPAILFACAGSVYRGYYEGLGDMVPTAGSEVAEALVKLAVGTALSGWVVKRCTAEYAAFGTVFSIAAEDPDAAMLRILSFAAAGAVIGVTCGSGAALLFLVLRHRWKGDGIHSRMVREAPPPRSRRETAKRLMAVTVPIALGSLTANVAGLIDAALLQNRLVSVLKNAPRQLIDCFPGMIPPVCLKNPESIPTFLYGCYTLAMTVYLLVPAMTQAFGVSALPAVTEAWAKGSRGEIAERMGTVCRMTALFCFPAGLGITALAGPIVRVLYGEEGSSPIVAGVLALLGAASLGAAMCAPFSSMLQAVGRADLPVKLLAAAMTLKLALNWLLCGIPRVNLFGAAAGTLISYLFLAAGEFFCLRRATGARLSPARLFARPLICAALCGLSAHTCSGLLSRVLPGGTACEAVSLGVSVLCGGLFYCFALLILGDVKKSEVKLLPCGQKFAKSLEKWGWI